MLNPIPLTPDKILQDLEMLYTQALASDNLALAVKIKEIQGKYLELSGRNLKAMPQRTLEEMTDDELLALLG